MPNEISAVDAITCYFKISPTKGEFTPSIKSLAKFLTSTYFDGENEDSTAKKKVAESNDDSIKPRAYSSRLESYETPP